jgi:hypothetical protein
MLAAVKNPQPKPSGHEYWEGQMNAMRRASSVAIFQVLSGDLAQRRPIAMLHAGLDLSGTRLDLHLLDEQDATIQVIHAPDGDGLRGLASRVATVGGLVVLG